MALLSDAIARGTIGSRPAAGSPGRVYFSTEPASYRDNGSSWDDVSDPGTGAGIPDTILDAKGDIIVATAADTAARLAVGATNDFALVVASGESTGLKWAVPRVTVSEGILGAPVTMTNANQFYDGPTITPAAGKYMFLGRVLCTNNSSLADNLAAKLWDGTTVIDENFLDIGPSEGAGAQYFVTLMGTFTASGSTAIKVSCAFARAGGSIAINIRANSASSGTASRIECWPCN